MAVSFKIPPGVTDKTIEATLDKLQNAIQKFGTNVDAQSVEVENKNNLLNTLATELYTFDIQLQEFKDNFSAGTESQIDDKEAADVRAELAEFQNKLVANKFSIEEANTLITNLATFFGNAVDIYEEEVPEGKAEKQTIKERNAAAKKTVEAGGEEIKAAEEAVTGEPYISDLGKHISSVSNALAALILSVEKYMGTDPGPGDTWDVPADVLNKLILNLGALAKATDEFAQYAPSLIEIGKGNKTIESLPETLTSLHTNIQAVLSLPAAIPLAKVAEPGGEKVDESGLEEFNAVMNEAISNFDRSLYNIDSAFSYTKKSIEDYVGGMPTESGKVWIVDELAEKSILEWLNEIIINLPALGESAEFIYQYTDENEDLKPLLDSAQYAEMLKELLGGGIDTESRKKEFINSLIAIYDGLRPLINKAWEKRSEIFQQIYNNLRKGTVSGLPYDQAVEFVSDSDDITKEAETVLNVLNENMERIESDIITGLKAGAAAEVGESIKEVEQTKVERKEIAQQLDKALKKGIDDFSKMRKNLQSFVNDITKKPIDFKKLGDDISDITTDYGGLVSDGISVYGNILNGNFDYDAIGKVMDQYREALVNIVADFPGFVASKLTGAELRDIGKGLLSGFGSIFGTLFGKSATKTTVGIATSAGYYVVPILFALQIFVTS